VKNKNTSFASKLTNFIGSWNFIIFQSFIILIWITGNLLNIFKFDSYPFVFLNLALSFQAAFTAPIIMMSQNKEAETDRKRAKDDYAVNMLAEKEIEEVIDYLLEIKKKLY
jgi:uncharacterized membrane protein